MSAPDTTAIQKASARPGPFDWYRNINQQERRTFWSCKIGYGLDGMDTQMLSFVVPTLIAMWGITTGQAGLIHTSTLIASAIGGWVAGILSDRIGRVRTLQLTVLWFAFFTFLCGFAQNYEQLLIARTLMGFGFGGEWTAGAVLIGEVIRAQDRGKAVGMVQSGWALGWGLTAILYALLFSIMPPEDAWRALFILGIVPAIFVIFVRRLVKDPEIYREAKARQEPSNPSKFYEIFAPGMLFTTIRASLLTTGALGGYYAITSWLPTFLKNERGLSVLGTGGYLAMVIIGSYVGYVISAYLTDILGRKKNFILFAVGSFTIVLLYTQLPVSNGVMLWLGFPLGFFASGIFSGMGAFLTELFPTRIRGSGQGFCYNIGRALAALFPLLIGLLSQTVPLSVGIGAFAAVSYGVVILAALSLPETRGKQLDAQQLITCGHVLRICPAAKKNKAYRSVHREPPATELRHRRELRQLDHGSGRRGHALHRLRQHRLRFPCRRPEHHAQDRQPGPQPRRADWCAPGVSGSGGIWPSFHGLFHPGTSGHSALPDRRPRRYLPGPGRARQLRQTPRCDVQRHDGQPGAIACGAASRGVL